MIKITGQQCKAARGLLKWNIHDLSHRCHMPPRRIESFERGILQLQLPENDELVKIYKEQGIEFKGDLEVKLGNKKGTVSGGGSNGSGVGQRITVDSLTLDTLDKEEENDYASKLRDDDDL